MLLQEGLWRDGRVRRPVCRLDEQQPAQHTLVVAMNDNGMNTGQRGVSGMGNAAWPQNTFGTSATAS